MKKRVLVRHIARVSLMRLLVATSPVIERMRHGGPSQQGTRVRKRIAAARAAIEPVI